MELPVVFPIRSADASFVSEFFSGREPGSPLGLNPFNPAMNESPTLRLGDVVHNDVQVFDPTFVASQLGRSDKFDEWSVVRRSVLSWRPK